MSNPLYSAIKRSVTGKLLTYIVQFLALTIYARIFTPEQFGIIASIQVFVVFFQLLADVGIGPAIINEDTFTTQQRDGIFSTTLILGLLLGCTFYAFSFILNVFYNGYQYQDIATLVSISILFNSLNIVPITALNKDAEFIKIAKIDCLVELISLSIIFVLYQLNFGVMALAVRPLSQSIFRFLFIWIASSKTTIGRPKFGSQLFHIKKIASFASYQFAFNLINYFSRNLDKILVGKYIGSPALGLYEKSYQLMQYPLMITTFAMTPAIQPTLTKIRNNVAKIVEEHNKLAKRLLLISLLISTFMYINANQIVLILFGLQWEKVTPLIEIFAFMIPIQAVMSTSGSFFQTMNSPKLLFISGFLASLTNITAIFIGIYYNDLSFIAYSLLISFSINFIQCYTILFHYCFKARIKDFLHLLMQAIFTSIPPILLYVISWIIIKPYLHTNIYIEFITSLTVSILALVLFSKQLKKALLM
ncbi:MULTISPECIES: oligosaccharide flippase family protein [Providencia]|uniref:oligosaccharide flippase family protein n=1 Tax=Providencia TaxID=586 RepID=UPI00234A9EF8|nr:oligosaccharide flippase family protein [Providencia sp. PROV110]